VVLPVPASPVRTGEAAPRPIPNISSASSFIRSPRKQKLGIRRHVERVLV
jgi:hypothetical protein